MSATMEESETLLSNAHGTICAMGPDLLICDCQGENFDGGVRRITAFALLLTVIVLVLVWLRAIPWPMALIPLLWSVLASVALVLLLRRRRRHGSFRLDFERGEIEQRGRGFQRRFALSSITCVTTDSALGEPETETPGLEARWLVVCLSDGRTLRLGKAPGYALRPTLAFLRRAGLEIR